MVCTLLRPTFMYCVVAMGSAVTSSLPLTVIEVLSVRTVSADDCEPATVPVTLYSPAVVRR